MADRIGVLGGATTATAATTTVYTVPSSKAAKGRLFYEIQGAADGTTDFTITVNGIDVLVHSNITASNYLFSSPNALKEGPLAAQATGVDGDTTCTPAPNEYFLSAADVVTYTIAGTTALACNVQFVGTEIDV
jgi:hypothetical protein|tara:strand:+ start:4834 stop:5232 length:399 start_codon:yes stop_codon:yes gene_type:complete